MKEKPSSDTPHLPEEDLLLISAASHIQGIDRLKFAAFLVMSVVILATYLSINYAFYPGYPVATPRAEQDTVFAEHYPPFRMDEWTNYSITRDILDGKLSSRDSFARKHPIGFAAISVPLTAFWGKAGPYFTNAFVLWASALTFFFIALRIVSFPVAVGATFFLALATPNMFYSASAFAEPLGQLFMLMGLFLFLRGKNARRQWMLFSAAGFSIGLTLFVQPSLAGIMVPFIIHFSRENNWQIWQSFEARALIGGFMLPFLAYMLTGVFLTGEYFPFLFGLPYSPYNPLSYRPPGEAPHIAVGIWEMLLGSPHGLAALMPVIILVPPGFIAMWRGGCSLLAAISGFMIILVIAFAACSIFPISGEGLGSRQLIPILPLLILPLAFLWEEGNGERIWLAALAACTVYMGGLSWAGGPGPLAEKLLDREARSILLSRKNIFGTEKYKSSEELVSRFTQALGEHDIAKWLKTLSPVSRQEILGIERAVFDTLSQRSGFSGSVPSDYIQSADSTLGIHLLIPDLNEEEIEQEPKKPDQ